MAIQSKEMEQVDNTVIGESILINGKLEGDEDLTVRGRVHGSITLTKTLIIEPSGVVKADATVRNAIISGVVVGNITASESVHLTKEGRMVGDINSPRVIIVEGAAFRGRVDMGAVDEVKLGERAARAATTPASKPAVRPMTTTPPRPPPAPPKPAAKPAAAPSKAPEAFKPPAPPPPPPPALKIASDESAPVPVGLGKRKVVVKRKK